jgi:hypothetical protein
MQLKYLIPTYITYQITVQNREIKYQTWHSATIWTTSVKMPLTDTVNNKSQPQVGRSVVLE